MNGAETPTPAPEPPADEPETEHREEEAPIAVSHAWVRVLEAVARVPQDDVTRAIAGVARASIRAETERAEQPNINEQVRAGLAFLEQLGGILDLVERNKAACAEAVMTHLFSNRQPHPGPNGAFR